MKRKIFLKFFLSYFLIILALELSNLLIANHIFRVQSRNILSGYMKDNAATIEYYIKNKNPQEMENVFREITRRTGIRITVINTEGTVITDSQQNPENMENHSNRPEFKKAIENGEGNSVRWSSTLDKHLYYYAVRIKKPPLVLRVSIPTDEIGKFSSFFAIEFFRMTLLLVFIGIAFSLFLAKIMTAPIYEILRVSKEAISGFSENRTIIKSTDEIGKILENINTLGLTISCLNEEKQLKEIEIEKFSGLLDIPFAIITQQGNIVFASSAFEEIAKIERKQGLWWERIRVLEINEMIRESIEDNKAIQKEIQLNERYFLSKTFFLQDRLILTMFDISSIKKMEKMRKDFVVAASHELKTPLTAIKGYVETLQDEIDNPEQKNFIGIINQNISRLEKIVEDLIVLSRLEDASTKINIEPVDMKKIVENVINLYMKKAIEKNIELKLDAKEIPPVPADGFKIEQLFINLIDNAIKFTEKGSIIVYLTYQKENSTVKIEVSDTGIGIPNEHLPRIFERFYVVDKARSRQSGGTGLGLSIVKHIVLLHNGTVDVESKPGYGTKFIIQIPLKV